MNNPYAAPAADLSSLPLSGDTYEPDVFSLHGRIGRVRYLAYSCAYALVAFVAAVAVIVVMNLVGKAWMASAPLVSLALLWIAGVFSAVRRLNDMDFSGWLSILVLVPYLNLLAILWLACARGTHGENNYGQAPCANSRGVVAAAWLVPAFMVISIAAAIAIPAYQGYTMRAAQHNSAPAPADRLGR